MAFGHNHKVRRQDGFHSSCRKGIYLEIENGLHCIYWLQSKIVATTKHVSFDEN